MSKNAAGAGAQVTLSINIDITKMENAPADAPPNLLITFPKQAPLPISLIKQDGQSSSPPSAKTPRKKPDSAESKPIQYIKHAKTQIDLPNPTELAAVFVSELLTFQLGDAGGKGGKGGAGDGTMQKIDASPLLVNLPLNEHGLICSQGNFLIQFDVSIKIIGSTHPEQRINSFMNPKSTDQVPFVFQVSYFEGVPQIANSKYRTSFYKPAKCKVELFGQSFWSEEIPQSQLGDGQYSSRAPIRVNCNFLSKSQAEIQALKLKIDEAVAVVTVYTRVEMDQEYEPGAAPAAAQGQKGGQAPQTTTKAKNTSFIKVCGRACVPLKSLLRERRLQVKAHLVPSYDLIGDGLVPTEQEATINQQMRAPDLRVSRAPPVPDDPKKVKGAPEQPAGPTNDFTELQRLPNAEPVGDWTNAVVKLTAALTYSLDELVPPPMPGNADQQPPTQSRPSSQVKGKVPAQPESNDFQIKKPNFQHLEHMLIYAYSTQIDAIKELLSEICTINVKFCGKFGIPEVQRQFVGEHAGTFTEQTNYLASLTLNVALGKQKGAQETLKNMNLPVITGYRFVDLQTMTLMFLEAPAQYDLLSQISVKAKQMGLVVKEGPAIVYQSRQFADGSLMLETFSLSKSFLNLTTKFSQTVKYLKPLVSLFHYDKDNKNFLPLAMDLREMSLAGLGVTYSEYQEIIKYYSGSIPVQHGIESLFQLPEQQPATSPPYFSNLNSPSTVSSPGNAGQKLRSLSNSLLEPNQSGSKIVPTDSFQLLQAIVKPIIPKRYPFTTVVDTPDIPASLIEQFEIAHKAAQDNDYEAEEQQQQLALQEQEAQNNAILERQQQFQQYCDDVANDIHSNTQLRNTTMIKKALLGRQKFHYSGQLLNQQNIRYRISEFNARKPLPQMRSIRKKQEEQIPEEQPQPELQETNEAVQEEKQEGEVEAPVEQSPERPQSGKSQKSQKSTKTKQ